MDNVIGVQAGSFATAQLPACLAGVFEATARRIPEKPLYIFRERVETYGSIDAQASRWASALNARGIGPGDFVGVWVDRSIELHVAVLAILKAGAAFLPFDPDAPRDRIEISVEDCRAPAVIIDPAHLDRAAGLSVPVISVLELDEATNSQFHSVQPAPTAPAYAIYTSGSTGKPKGIAVSQSNICHFIQSENSLFGVREDDIVYQGFSPAFDMSLEELLISYSVGATLVIGPPELVRAADALPAFLRQAGVTVLHCVPTLLAMLDEDVASIRLINMGGEACPAALVDRWWKPGRQLFNSYGPTETTVSATATELRPGDSITIGKPLPGYTAYILDEVTLAPVPHGEGGELFIGGPGVAIGYIGRPELTSEKFIQNPVPEAALADPRIYRTGDKASFDDEGRIRFHGRLDDQVKFRGYRIETGEIEAALGKLDAVRAAAVVLREDRAGTQHLVAYVAMADGAGVDPKELRGALGTSLPSYMLPTLFKDIDVIPRLPSGKINRKALPELTEPVQMDDNREVEPPANPIEEALQVAWQAQFPHARVGVTDDFFLDLGGHSLLAAQLTSRLRQDARFTRISIQDLYDKRNIRALAVGFAGSEAKARSVPPFHAVPWLRHALCGLAQAVALVPIFALYALLYVVPYYLYSALMDDHSIAFSLVGALLAFIVTPPLITCFAIAMKWILLGRVQPGEYPLWGFFYFRWWLAQRLLSIVPPAFMSDTPVQSFYLRLLGAKIGRDVHLGSVFTGAPDLVSIGANTALGNEVYLSNTTVERGVLRIGRIEIGKDVYIGSRCVIESGSVMGDRAELESLSSLNEGARVPQGEIWRGSPAAFHRKASAASEQEQAGTVKRVAWNLIFLIAVIVFPLLGFLPIVPGIVVFDQIYDGRWQVGIPTPILILGVAFVYITLVLTEIVVLRWVLLGRVKAGSYSLRSSFYLRKWFVDHLMEMALGAVHAIYASLYVVPWLRLLGMRIGSRSEVSTVTSITHDLVEIGEEAFVADGVMLGDADIRHGILTLRETKIGRRSFLGNASLVADGNVIPDECLVGCLSVVPAKDDLQLTEGQTCLGTPAFIIPKRQSFLDHASNLTFKPGPARVLARLFVEGIRILAPPLVFIALLSISMERFDRVDELNSTLISCLAVPVVYLLGFGLPTVLIVIVLKWIFIGRYRKAEVPMWTSFVWRSEAVTALYEAIAVPYLLEPLRGTPFLPWIWRLFGVRVGKRVYTETHDITEFDMVQIGDDAALLEASGPQTHLFEDRVMKIGPVQIGARSVLGTSAIALYGSSLGDDVTVGSVSLVMKGESLPVGTVWQGSPARAQD